MKKSLKKYIPPSIRRIIWNMIYFPLDLAERAMNPGKLIAPRSLRKVRDGHWLQVGQEFKQHFIEWAELQPSDRVLDIGCGVGRMAAPLTDYLSPEGEFWGFDIRKDAIDWCRSHISAEYSNFHFEYQELVNQFYTPGTQVLAKDYCFPFNDGYFDLIYLISVFSHMLPLDVAGYMKEISRMLKPGGNCLMSVRLFKKEVGMADNPNFRFKVQDFYTRDEQNPEAGIAYEEGFVQDLCKQNGLRIAKQIFYGSWSHRKGDLDSHNIIVATKDKSN